MILHIPTLQVCVCTVTYNPEKNIQDFREYTCLRTYLQTLALQMRNSTFYGIRNTTS